MFEILLLIYSKILRRSKYNKKQGNSCIYAQL